MLFALTNVLVTAEEKVVEFVLFKKLAETKGIDLYFLLGALALVAVFVTIAAIARRKVNSIDTVTTATKSVFAVLLAIIGFAVTYVITMVVQASAALLKVSESVSISDITSYTFTEQQFTNRILLSIAVGVVLAVAYSLIVYFARNKVQQSQQINPLRALVFGALALSLSFALSYVKILQMPFGGAITLFSMLPIMVYATWVGPKYGFLTAFAYGLLQIIQDAYIIHWAQFLLDYFLAFTCLGLASFFPKKPEIGIFVGGISRMLCSVVSGVIFFASCAPEGMNVWAYSFAYNALSIGIDTLLCVGVYCIPAVNIALTSAKRQLTNA